MKNRRCEQFKYISVKKTCRPPFGNFLKAFDTAKHEDMFEIPQNINLDVDVKKPPVSVYVQHTIN